MTRLALVVDDEPDIRRLLVADLVAAGYEVIELDSGERVHATALEKEPDIIVLDLTMPRVNGYEALRQLNVDPRTTGIPVIVASAKIGKSAQILCRDLGAVDFLAKPWEDGELIWRVEQVLGPDPDRA
ncbi:MAG: response regulator [Chloroflexi bacterium]|nr:response regulator [Chloroflexota bacterium]